MIHGLNIYSDQDQDLDVLSSSVSRQRELGLQINDELDVHSRLIDETETMVDRTQQRLDQAKKKLDYVSRRIKDNSK
jgi:syntaxin 8